MLYQITKKIAAVGFNLLNLLLGGNLPPFTCASVIIHEGSNYLVIERPQGEYVFPGGFVRWREHPKQTARREGKEETGLDLQIQQFIGHQVFTSRRLDIMSAVNLMYRAEVTGGELHASMEGKPCWLAESELPGKLAPVARDMFEEYERYRARYGSSLAHHFYG